MRRLANILFWSILAAAFIGPGTVTTAASAGSGYTFDLAWALLFSIFACMVLQEAAARITVVSGHDLGEVLRKRYLKRRWIPRSIALGIVLGCAAYEAGNILGGVAGLRLVVDWPVAAGTVATVAVAALLLQFGSSTAVARSLGVVVALMAVAFVTTAFAMRPAPGGFVEGLIIPRLPSGSFAVVLALVGTTVVPYNLFLGSSLARGQRLSEVRFGLIGAVALGGAITMAILVVGTAVNPPLEFARLSEVLASRLGVAGSSALGWGLAAAGFSSAITAPLAAGLTARSLLQDEEDPRATLQRSTWMAVLLVGLLFGLSGLRPIPMIILAQAFNGAILPAVAIFLCLAVNDRRLMGMDELNGKRANVAMGIVLGISLLLGLTAIGKAISRGLGMPPLPTWISPAVAMLILTGLAVPLVRQVRRLRSSSPALADVVDHHPEHRESDGDR